jgi:hypothetical protein
LKEGEDIHLEKDPTSDTYFPCVEAGTKVHESQGQMVSPPHTGLSSKEASQTSKENLQKFPDTKALVVTTPSNQWKTFEGTTTWKKRVRVDHGLERSTDSLGGAEGKKKVEREADDMEEYAKKGNKSQDSSLHA